MTPDQRGRHGQQQYAAPPYAVPPQQQSYPQPASMQPVMMLRKRSVMGAIGVGLWKITGDR